VRARANECFERSLRRLHHREACNFLRWTACRRWGDAATGSAAEGIVGVVGRSRRERKRRVSRRNNFSHEKRRATAREHFRHAVVSGMIKNRVARYKKINTFHYRNPGNGTEHLYRGLRYEREKEKDRVTSREGSHYFHQRVSQTELKFRIERKRKYLASPCDFEQLRIARANTRVHSVLPRLLKSERSSDRESWSNPRLTWPYIFLTKFVVSW